MNRVEIFENERATGYNQFVTTWIPNYEYYLDCLPKLLRDVVQKDLLVVGCGTGNEIQKFVQDAAHWRITGIDPSPEMTQQANSRFQNRAEVTIREGLVSDLDIQKKYNAATLSLVLHFLDDEGSKLQLLTDIADRLAAGATFILLDITGDQQQIKQNLHILRLLLPDDLDQQQIEHRLTRIENELCLVSEDRISELLQEAGFEPPLRFFQSSIYMGWWTKKKINI